MPSSNGHRSRELDLEHGRAVQAAVTGTAAAARARDGSSALIPELAELSDEVNWGRIWGRDGLDLKSRSLCVIVCLLTLGRYTHALSHMQGARRVGITREELSEAVLQLTFYAGLPVVHEGLALVKKVFDEASSP